MAVTVDVSYEARYWYPDDGAIVWLEGYQLIDAASGRYLARDAAQLQRAGLRVASVAGAARHHAEPLQSEAVAPGRTLELRRDVANEHDANAIAVHAAGADQIGWIPREFAATIAPELDAGTTWTAVALREARRSPREPRTGLTMLLAPTDRIALRLHDRRPPARA